MVNTRRTESVGSTPELASNTQHRTRKQQDSEDSSTVNDSESTHSEEAEWEGGIKAPAERKKGVTGRVRELRSRFVCNQHKYKTSVDITGGSKRKRVSLNESHSLSVCLSSRKMHESDMYNGNDSDEDRFKRKRRSRHLHQSYMARIERRTALSLRPIGQKSYADPISDSDLPRSTRQRKMQNMSWLADDQMHKVGYPNLNYFEQDEEEEEDSRDVPVETRRNSDIPVSKRREIKNPKYLREYETEELSPRRRSDRNKSANSTAANNNKENSYVKLRNNNGGKVDTKVENNEIGDSNDSTKIDENSTENNADSNLNSAENKMNSKEVDKNGNSSESDDGREGEKEAKRSNNSANSIGFTRRRNNNKTRRPFVDSSSSESERKAYSLRTRAPKPAPSSMKSSVMRNHELPRSRKRFNRRRNAPNSSSSSDSDSDFCHTKTPKGGHSKNEQKMKSGAGGSKIIPIGPETLDSKVRFSSIGGLDGHVQCLKEMILLPMMYPEVFRQFQIQPPRGVLFHGPPGTGKTLIARALANECTFGSRKVSFFMRKGADLLSKWIGESEKQLRLLFEQASEMHPSIIFFDELDGLAPVRSSRQDQVHASIVSTLLALMDGLDNRGEVIVIGATNRIDAIDPALRRPGRFDRELFFPLPAAKEREAILRVHVAQWRSPPSDDLLQYLADNSVGYCGSDLRALCSEAVIQSFRRTYPQVYDADYRLMLEPENVRVEKVDFLRAKSLLVPAAHRVAHGLGRRLMALLEPLLMDAVKEVMEMLEKVFPHAGNAALAKVKLSPNMRPAQLLLLGESADSGQTLHLAPALLYKMEHIHAYTLDLSTLHRDSGRSAEESTLQVFTEARRNVPSVIYIPNIDTWWTLVSETVRSILTSQIMQLEPNLPILILATADTSYDNLNDDIQAIFSRYRREIYHVDAPNEQARRMFFEPLLIGACLKPPRMKRRKLKTPPPLPRAKTPPPTPLTEEQAKKLYEHEEHTLRELRIFLRDICKKLANNKLFYMFTKPVDTEEVPDYTTIIKQPMDLETMMTKVDFHRYECAKDFLNDIELICQNALEYNPARTSADKQIRHRACSLRDYAYTLIKNEMDSDFEEKCQDIATKRCQRNASIQKYLPAYIQTPDNANIQNHLLKEKHETNEAPKQEDNEEKVETVTLRSSARKRKLVWQKGCVKKRRKREKAPEETSDEENNTATLNTSVCPLSMMSFEEDEVEVEEQVSVDGTKPLTIDCNNEINTKQNEQQSPKRRLSALMSPSELLENSMEFDDIDQALNEENSTTESEKILQVDCDQAELQALLDSVVKITSGQQLQSLLDLYNQLNSIIKKYSNTHLRTNLPKELEKEINRFKNELSPEIISVTSPSSSQS